MTKMRPDNPPRDLTQAPRRRGSTQPWVPPAEQERRAKERRKDEADRAERAREAYREQVDRERAGKLKAMGIEPRRWLGLEPEKPE
jgi:hypothetical protein